MEIIKCNKICTPEIIQSVAHALRYGKVVAYPTETSYGLGALANNLEAIIKLYKIKERHKNQPIHVLVANKEQAKKLVWWPESAQILTDKFWPGPLTLVLKIKTKQQAIVRLTGNSGFLGVRQSSNPVAAALIQAIGMPITTPSANPSKILSGGVDSYSGNAVYEQFKQKKYRPDIILDAGKIPKTKPSTIVKISQNSIEILREGEIKSRDIYKVLGIKSEFKPNGV